MAEKINAARVKGRRALRFESLDEALAEAERLLVSPERVRTLGNMGPAQAVEHLARWVDASIDGFAGLSAPPRLLRWTAQLLRRRFLNGALPAGAKLPQDVQDRFTPPRDQPAASALEHYRSAIARFNSARTFAPSMLLGPLSREEWIKLHCRHAELHFSFHLPPD